MSLKEYLKRTGKFILKGIPTNIINLEIVQKTPQEIFKSKKILITGGGRGLGF